MPRYLVTSALPYTNGPIHFGHVVGAYLPADVYVRTLRQCGDEVLFVCGGDEHGVAITVGAEAEGVPYPEYVARWRGEIHSTLQRLGIAFDVWSGTSICPQHAATTQEFFRRLDERGYLERRQGDQLYCPKDRRFLADRYIVGTCPSCGFESARGDECPRCGSWIDPLQMPVARCKLCGTTPERRSTVHWYLDLPRLRDEHIGRWVAEHDWKPNVAAFIENMLRSTAPRAITRDLPWGVPVPPDRAAGEQGKVIYVWFDAPIGYVSFTQEWAERGGQPEAWRRWWQDPQTRLVHFIGKDNIPFHCFVFPAMLHGVGQGYVLPWAVPASEFFNLEGGKFSTSEGRTLPLEPFFERYDAESARFYLLSSTPETADSEWSWKGFQACTNAALADTIGNLVTRVLRFVERYYEGRVPKLSAAHEEALDRQLLGECGPISDPAEQVRAFRFRRAAEQLIENARVANVFVDRSAPWSLRKSDPELAASVLDTCCQYLLLLARWMAPFLPGKAQALWTMLGQPGAVADSGWPGLPRSGDWRRLPPASTLGPIQAQFSKLEDADIERELRELRG